MQAILEFLFQVTLNINFQSHIEASEGRLNHVAKVKKKENNKEKRKRCRCNIKLSIFGRY